MSYVVSCSSCGDNFTKFSNASKESRCFNCRQDSRANVHVNLKNRRANEVAEVLERIDTLEQDVAHLANSVNTLHDAIDVAVNAQLTTSIVSAIDEHYSSITKALATVNTRSKKAFDIASSLRNQIEAIDNDKPKVYMNVIKGVGKRRENIDGELLSLQLLDWLESRKTRKHLYFPRRFLLNTEGSPWASDIISPETATKLLTNMVRTGMLETNGMKRRGRMYRLPRVGE